MADFRIHLLICAGTGCTSNRSLQVREALEEEIKRKGLQDEAKVVITGCNGFCAVGPILVVYPEGIFYQKLTTEDVPHLVEEHILKGRPVTRLMYTEPTTKKAIPLLSEINFFSHQVLRALRNRGMIDPESIDEYIARDGYRGLGKALTSMTSKDIIEEMKKSGLRGRGGAGFPTHLKWQFCAQAKGDVKFVLCNGDEGDPGAFMDRSILEADPHAVLEGLTIAGKTIGAHQGYIYVRAEYPLAVERLKIAILQAKEYGLLGKDILGSGYDFDMEIYPGAGAFVCGEETALMTSIEGKRGMPRPRPPFPAHQGLWRKPSVLNNVETLANIPQIILNGGDWYASIGTEKSKGTKVFALAGAVNNIGLVEVPMGIPLRSIIYDIGDGIQGGREFKAVQMGGPSGGCLPASMLDTPVDYDSINATGAIMGSGGMVIMDETACMVDMAKFFLTFTQEESCGKCTPCRIGTKMMLDILIRISQGEGEEKDIKTLEDLARTIKTTALCGLGQTAPNPVLTTLRYFKEEFEAHVIDKTCPAKVCKRLTPAPCQDTCPAGIDVPSYVALISWGRYQESLDLIRKDNPFPAICGRVCTHPCESNCKRGETDKPVSIKALKRFVADYEKKTGRKPVDKVEITQKEKVAVIGAGPAGLTCARDLALKGYAVTVFEALPIAGGLLTMGIPDYRLPQKEVEVEINDIRALGVEIKTNTPVGGDLTLEDLRKEYEAVFIGVGAWKSLKLNIPGEGEFEGFLDCLTFLKNVNLGEREKPGDKVVVIGGGNAAIDAARTSIRLGAREVHIVYRRSREEMPASKEEVDEAAHEGVVINYLAAPLKVLGDGGRVAGLECIRTELGEPDASGRRRPVPIKGSEFVISVDVILPAIGQQPDSSFLDGGSGIKVSKWNSIEVDPDTLQTNVHGIFAGGDAVTGPATVIEAIAAGQKAAVVMDNYLRRDELTKGQKIPRPRMLIDLVEMTEEMETYVRPEVPAIDVEERRKSFKEAELGFEEEVAVCESKRCLRCDAGD
jgi:NADH-quinone oxidoreductase subunit F